MQQEQWENEGRVGSMYDTDFRLLNTEEEMGTQRLSQIDPIALENERNERKSGQWPLSSDKQSDEKLEPSADKSPAVEQQPQFKLTPTIPQSPRVPSPNPTSARNEKPTTTRLPEPTEETPEKNGKCCIVM